MSTGETACTQKFPRPRGDRGNAERRIHDVVLVISDLGGGGTQRVLTRLANDWTAIGLRVCIVTLSGSDGDRYALHPAVDRVALNAVSISSGKLTALTANARRLFRLRQALRFADAPVVISFLTTTNILTILAAAGLPARVVVSERNDPERQQLPWPWPLLRRWTYAHAHMVTANTHGALHWLRGFVPAPKLLLVRNPLNQTPAPLNRGNRNKVILNVGRLSHQKAQDVLLKAYAEVIEKAPDWRLTIAGDGPKEPQLRELASVLGIADRVRWIKWTDDVDSLYRSSGIFVLPSRYEGMPNALLEAMSHGLPAIVTDASPGPLDCIIDGETGLVVKADNVPMLVTALTRLVESTALRVCLGTEAHKRILEFNDVTADQAWMRTLGELPISATLNSN